ncbi:MAG: hypothetical protein IT204_02040 [Fimbriimonadaceae bacterium]|nr:hypothetical protein [Fimbriimonadaceae bacterium]
MNEQPIRTPDALAATVAEVVATTPIFDLHTHLFAPCFGDLLLYGVDELLTYHYLISEVHRADPALRPADFYAQPKPAQADLIWRKLFVEAAPLSEATRGVVTVLQALGVDPQQPDLRSAREAVASYSPTQYVDLIFSKANVSAVVMTNDPFDAAERPCWENDLIIDPRFHAALRIDNLLLKWAETRPLLNAWGYAASDSLDAASLKEVRRFLNAWIDRMDPVYLAASLPADFTLPAPTPAARLLEQAVLPVSVERGVPFAFMPGVKRGVNPALGQAGDGVARCDLAWIEYLCRSYPENRFLTTVLARENQHELCVIARKFSNLLPFGCWWFLNNPSLIEELTRMRFEMLGLSQIPQHSDCRILDQLLYKWAHFRPILGKVLGEKYQDLLTAGWAPTRSQIQRDVKRVLGENFWSFLPR